MITKGQPITAASLRLIKQNGDGPRESPVPVDDSPRRVHDVGIVDEDDKGRRPSRSRSDSSHTREWFFVPLCRLESKERSRIEQARETTHILFVENQPADCCGRLRRKKIPLMGSATRTTFAQPTDEAAQFAGTNVFLDLHGYPLPWLTSNRTGYLLIGFVSRSLLADLL